MTWILSLLSGGVLDSLYKLVVGPFLQAYLKSKDVDLAKFQSADVESTQLALAVLDANVRYAAIKAQYSLAILQWWPFRVLLFVLISICITRFALAEFDDTWWWIFGCTIDGKHVLGDACSWSIPAIRGTFSDVEKQFLLFFIVAKPVDTAVSGTVNLVSRYLGKSGK